MPCWAVRSGLLSSKHLIRRSHTGTALRYRGSMIRTHAAPGLLFAFALSVTMSHGQAFPHHTLVELGHASSAVSFSLVRHRKAAPIYFDPSEQDTLGLAVEAFASDVE